MTRFSTTRNEPWSYELKKTSWSLEAFGEDKHYLTVSPCLVKMSTSTKSQFQVAYINH